MFTPTIGLEVHAELKTASKMFCGCQNDPHASEPNLHICPVCMAHPGTLPVPNATAIQLVAKFGTAVNGHLATYTEFDRKNYFYPDIPKAYQISQYEYPFVTGGSVKGVALTRVHLEEDTARSQHEAGTTSLVDFNRAGVPLLELVTEPVIHSAEAAVAFARELQLLFRTIGVSDANMEKGEMRVEANISLSDSDKLGTKVEVKNLNSFKAVEQAIEYEIRRQRELLERGEAVSQETRGWDEQKGKTYAQRAKETANDYRYFPDPDLPKMDLGEMPEFAPAILAASLPDLPEKKREKYSYLGLPSSQIEIIIADKDLDRYFADMAAIDGADVKTLQLSANYLLTDVIPLLNGSPLAVSPRHFYGLMELNGSKRIGSRVVKDLLIEFIPQAIDIDFAAVVAERNLDQTFSDAELGGIVDGILSANEAAVAEYRSGKTTVAQYLVGQVMKATKGAADPGAVLSLIQSKLG